MFASTRGGDHFRGPVEVEKPKWKRFGKNKVRKKIVASTRGGNHLGCPFYALILIPSSTISEMGEK